MMTEPAPTAGLPPGVRLFADVAAELPITARRVEWIRQLGLLDVGWVDAHGKPAPARRNHTGYRCTLTDAEARVLEFAVDLCNAGVTPQCAVPLARDLAEHGVTALGRFTLTL